MIRYPTLILALAGFDLLLLAVLYLYLLLTPRRIDRRHLIVVAFVLLGFVFHAFLFFDGPFLILQLATIGGVFGISAFFAFRRHQQS
jgi:hypothetical protein